MRSKFFRVLFYVIILTPLWMWLIWMMTPKKPLRVCFVDKTVLSTLCREHSSFGWVLKYKRFCRPNNNWYNKKTDYYGFFPKEDRKFLLQDIDHMQQEQIDKASDKYDLFYYTDTYGIYSNEWYGDTLINERSRLVYGGMSSHDLSLLKRAKARHKLIIAEFNTIATPTKAGIRHEFEDMFGVKWSGWVGKYFDVLDTNINYDLPMWLYRNYKKQHNGQWPFKRSGIAFVNIDDHVEVLENIKDLKVEVPYIVTAKRANRDRFTIPRRMKYPYWFDIMYTSHRNNVISTYLIEPTKRGDSILKHWGILKKFPAVIEHIDTNYRFYYFSGDFCDNPIRDRLNSFKGIWYFKPLFYNKKEIGETESFFWKFYMPMVTQILDEYYPIVNSKRHEK